MKTLRETVYILDLAFLLAKLSLKSNGKKNGINILMKYLKTACLAHFRNALRIITLLRCALLSVFCLNNHGT